MAAGKNDKNILMYKTLNKKQAIDYAFIVFVLVITYFITRRTQLSDIIMAIIFILIFIILAVILESTRRLVRNSIQKTVDEIMQETSEGTKSIENVISAQKDNVNTSVLKLTNVKGLLDHLKESFEFLNELMVSTKSKTEQSLDFANTENLAVKANIDKMFALRRKIQTIAEHILELSEFIQSISSMIDIVDDISEQTNLLALNAAVEAARAGEHGKGFAVVAGEIRKLADESKKATAKITSLVADIQQTTNSTVMATEEGTKEIETGLNLANNIGESVEQLIGFTSEISNNISSIMQNWQKVEQDRTNLESYTNELDVIFDNYGKTFDENYKNIESLNNLANTYRTFIDEE